MVTILHYEEEEEEELVYAEMCADPVPSNEDLMPDGDGDIAVEVVFEELIRTLESEGEQ